MPILAPLRGVTIRRFRETFSGPVREAGFTEAVTPFITASSGYDPLKDRELVSAAQKKGFLVTPQFIGKDPAALRYCLNRIKEAGYDTADLNCGCPFPMVRNKGRGSGLLRTPDVLRQMLEAGCSVMGPGKFSVKARLGVERPDELFALMPLFNIFPIKRLCVHARTAKQMYEGECDRAAFDAVLETASMPVVYNGDAAPGDLSNFPGAEDVMSGRPFIRSLAERTDIGELLSEYVIASRAELFGEKSVLGRIKELLSYWSGMPAWRGRWQAVKLARTLDELAIALGDLDGFRIS